MPMIGFRLKHCWFVLMAFASSSALSLAGEEAYIPVELEPWRDWVLHDHPDLACPLDAKSGNRMDCAWISELSINVKRQGQNSGADFHMSVQVYSSHEVALPVAGKYQPNSISLRPPRPQPVVVTGKSTHPVISMSPGRYEISGKFTWDTEPPSITIPDGVAQVNLSIDDEEVARPSIENNRLWLSRRVASREDNSLGIQVFRRFWDSTPQRLETRIKLTVAGHPRVADLGVVVPPEFTRYGASSALPIRFDENHQLSVNLRRGEYWVSIDSRSDELLSTLTPTQSVHPAWPNQEIWGIIDYPNYRTVTVEGGEPVDLTAVKAPFKGAKGFVLGTSESLELIEHQRGDPSAQPGEFKVERDLWLAFDGESMIVRDRIDAEIDGEMRIVADYIPGKVTVNSTPRLVTYIEAEGDDTAGVKLNASKSKIEAVSEIDAWGDISATGWQFDVASLSTTLNLPPGWRLLWTTGVDRVDHSWLSQWRLWDIFLALLLVVLIARTNGFVWAGIAAVTVLISYQDSPHPTMGWLVLIVITYLVRVIDSEAFNRWLKAGYWVVLVGVVVYSVLFAGIMVRQAIFLQLELPRSTNQLITPSATADGVSQVDLPRSLSDDTKKRESLKGYGRSLSTKVEGDFIRRDNFDLPNSDSNKIAASPQYASGLLAPTGPGTPTWNWHSINLKWSGPVTKQQSMSLTVIPPWLSRVIYVASAISVLVVSLFFVLLQLPNKERFAHLFKGLVPLLLLAVILPSGTDAKAQSIHPDILDELEKRLTVRPECLPDCASIETVEIQLGKDSLTTRFLVHVGDNLAVPIVDLSENIQPQSLSVTGLSRVANKHEKGVLYTFLPQGKHDLKLDINLAELSQFKMKFPLVPGTVSVTGTGWTVEGLKDGITTSGTLSFDRIDNGYRSEVLSQEWTDQTDIQPYVLVQRDLSLDINPTVQTRVARLAPRTGAFEITIPLLEGETVLDESMQVGSGKVKVVFGANTKNVQWKSKLALGTELLLTAPPITQWHEIWNIHGSAHWDYEAEGTPPIKSEKTQATYQPRSEETLLLRFERPISIDGETFTVESVNLNTAVGSRSVDATMSFTIEASHGGEFNAKLPDDAIIMHIVVAGKEQPTPLNSVAKLSIPPGISICEISWRQDNLLSLIFTSPEIELSNPARNVDLKVRFPESRWTLFVGGPPLGAAVTVWGVIAVILLIAVLLSRLPGFPMSTTDAVFLSIGATFANLWALLLVGIWMIGIWWRSNREMPKMSVEIYRLMQLAFVATSVIAILSLVFTIPIALFGQPEMQITGYGSSSYLYKWYDDGSGSSFPTAWVLSLPKWIYLVVMLSWSLWLVLALIKWVKKAWEAISRLGFWNPQSPLELAESSEATSAEVTDK